MTQQQRQAAERMLREFKGDAYVFGAGCLGQVGQLASRLGRRRVALVAGGAGKQWAQPVLQTVQQSLQQAGLELAGPIIAGAAPNSPRQDVLRIAEALGHRGDAAVLAVGGGSVIDAVKAAIVLTALGDRCGDVDACFGSGAVSRLLQQTGRRLAPMAAVQLLASSAAHLTRYANVTDCRTWQKKLIIDDAIVPPLALFDYRCTLTMPPDLTAEGAMDTMAHCLEVFYGLSGPALDRAAGPALLGIELVLANVQAACRDGQDAAARDALAIASDLGGYAIMIGGTSGGHLTSFSLVDLLPHGRACALMNPYYTVLFAPAIQRQLRDVTAVLVRTGRLAASAGRLEGRDLALAVAEAMMELNRQLGIAPRLADVPGFSDAHVRRALSAAKDPALESKLRNMPVPMTPGDVDEVMGGLLAAARSGDLSAVPA